MHTPFKPARDTLPCADQLKPDPRTHDDLREPRPTPGAMLGNPGGEIDSEPDVMARVTVRAIEMQ
jgi:hypothetical protein